MISRPLLVLTATLLAMAAPTAMAINFAIDTSDPTNGLTDLYSATFDGNLVPCSPSSPSYCSFFGGDTPAGRQVSFSANPTGVINAVPVGITPVPAIGSFLDVELTNGNTIAQIVGQSTIALPDLTLTIGSASGDTVVNTSGLGFVFEPSGTATVSGDGQVEFLVDLTPATAVDVSNFSAIFGSGDCTGPLCVLVPILGFDMVRYRLVLDFDATFTSFTGTFMGATNSNSRIDMTLNSTPPVPIPAAAWFLASSLGVLGALVRRKPSA